MGADGDGEVGAEELARVDALLRALPPVEPRPAVVRDVVARVSAKVSPRPGRSRARWLWGLASASGAAAAALIAVAVGRQADRAPAPMQEARAPSSGFDKNALGDLEPQRPVGWSADGSETGEGEGQGQGRPVVAEKVESKEDFAGRYRVTRDRSTVDEEAQVDLPAKGELANTRELAGLLGGEVGRDGLERSGEDTTLYWRRGFLDAGPGGIAGDDEGVQSGLRVPAADDSRQLAQVVTRLPNAADDQAGRERSQELATRDGKDVAPADPAQFVVPARGPTVTGRLGEQTIAANAEAPEEEDEEKAEVEAEDGDRDQSKGVFETQATTVNVPTDGRAPEEMETPMGASVVPHGAAPALRAPSLPIPPDEVPAFIEPRGYFANTYLPGDAELSWLRAQVAAGLPALGGLSVESMVAPVAQPFDAPRSGALGLHLASNVASFGSDTGGPRRVTLQLGLKGASQAPTRRSAVNLALVVDVAGIADEAERRAMWALAESLVGQAQPEDRIRLVIHTGQSERAPEVVAAARGEVSRVLAEAYERRGGARPLSDAVSAAYAAVRAGARQDAAMGSELVVLATPSLDGADGLAERAHLEALGGVHLSAMGVGRRVDLGAMRILALAGQGRASHVMGSAEADAAVGSELSAAGRVVARAVRLRVKLGDGVRLVSVLGSRRLDARDADKVRAAEKKIDLEVEETTGIASDRGTDEDGIQIVIPAFMAGDDHVILFDVVVERPGLVMDVRARFKDLVSLGNGEVSASLTLPSGASGRATTGPEQVNVTRNLAARRTSDALMLAASGLRRGDVRAAHGALVSGRAEVERIAVRSGLDKDSVLGSDLRLLGAFERALKAPEGMPLGPLESALRLAARLELGAR